MKGRVNRYDAGNLPLMEPIQREISVHPVLVPEDAVVR